jgi:hypothetical protein
MTIGEILIWESSNLFLLMPAVIGVLMLRRWLRGWPVFTDRDWVFLIGHPREKILSLHLWFKLGMLWFTVVLIGFAGGYILFPYGLPLFLCAVLIAGLVVLLLAPKLLRSRVG